MERRIRDDKREYMMLQETGDEEGLKKAAQSMREDFLSCSGCKGAADFVEEVFG